MFFWSTDRRIKTEGFHEKLAVWWAFAFQDVLYYHLSGPRCTCLYWLRCVACPPQLNYQQKVGIMYCKAGQSTEEEMYNNESAGPAFEEFLQLLGERIRLKGFEKYRAQLDTKSKKYLDPPTRLIFLLLCWCSSAKLPIKQLCHLLQKTADDGEEAREGGCGSRIIEDSYQSS